jgi:hypothetical protein
MPFSDDFRTHSRRGTQQLGGLSGHAFRAGVVKFTKSTDNETVTNYIVQIYALGGGTVLASKSIGKPTPYSNGDILVDVNDLLATLTSPGDYTVKVLAISPAGSTESTGDDFALPLT